MALGLQPSNKTAKILKIMEAQSGANGAPSGAPAAKSQKMLLEDAFGAKPGFPFPQASIEVWNDAGTGVLTVVGRIWVYCSIVADWIPLGIGTGADKGKLNEGNALTTTSTDKVRHTEPILWLGAFEGVYLEILSPGGTAPTWAAAIRIPKSFEAY